MPVPPPLVPDTTRRDWTVDERNALPDDGNRYEVVDGELLVTPAPSWTHQEAAGLLYRRISAYVEALGLYCLIALADVPLSRRTVVEPDVFVVPRRQDGALPRDFGEARQLTLAVEILSPSSARADRHVKRAAYLKHGVPDYWIVDLASRFVERWHLGDEIPAVLVDALTWQPMAHAPALVIDLPAYFRRLLGE